MKKAFTMIELIFIIVIIGILAVVAIPKLSSTTDDAKAIVEVNKIANCINDIATSYTATEKENIDTPSCKDIVCANIDIGNSHDGVVNVSLLNKTNTSKKYCDYVSVMAKKKKLEGKHIFSGQKISLF